MSLTHRLLVVAGLSLAAAAPAHAVPCSSFLAPWARSWVNATVSSNQSNGLLSGSTAAMMVSDGTWLQPFGLGYDGDWMFSDRYTGYQPFTMADADGIEVAIKLDGSEMDLHNLVWGNTVVILDPVCDQGLIYGFGAPVGRNPAEALYVVSLQPAFPIF